MTEEPEPEPTPLYYCYDGVYFPNYFKEHITAVGDYTIYQTSSLSYAANASDLTEQYPVRVTNVTEDGLTFKNLQGNDNTPYGLKRNPEKDLYS